MSDKGFGHGFQTLTAMFSSVVIAQNPGKLVFQKKAIDHVLPLRCTRDMLCSILCCDRISGYVQ